MAADPVSVDEATGVQTFAAEDAGKEATVTVPAAEEPVAAVVHPIDTLVDRWWNDHFPGSVVGRTAAVWNHAHAAKEELKARLKKLAV